MDPSVLSLKKKKKKHVVFEIDGNHSNEVNPPLKLANLNQICLSLKLKRYLVKDYF